MANVLDIIKTPVRALRPYSLTPERATIKINQNENPFDLPARIKAEAQRRFAARAWSRYPDFIPASLHERLAAFTGWTPDGIIAGNGSNELIQALMMVTIGEGKRVLLSEPTFALYRQVATVLGGSVISVPLTTELKHDAQALQQAIEQHQPEVTVICSPNNPTGCIINDNELVSLLRTARGLVVIDEAYFEFAEHTAAPLLGEHANLVVFRTFSKAMAAAAMRVGYLLAAPALAREISKAVLPYNLNLFSQILAETALDMYDAELAPLVGLLINERERLFDSLQHIEGLAPVKSAANFMVVKTTQLSPRRLFDELHTRDILVRNVSGYPMLKDYLRFSIGTPEENDALIAALKEVSK